jgi:hypothetical protein
MASIPARWNGKDAQGNPLRWNSPNLVWNGQINLNPPKRMPNLRVLLGFTNAPDHDVLDTAEAVSGNLYDEPIFNNPPGVVPPVSKADLDTAIGNLSEAIAAAEQGGPQQTADKNAKRDIVVDMLRKLAGHVQGKHENRMEVLLSSGFDAVSTSRAPIAITVPTIKDIANGNSGQLIVRVGAVRGARNYEIRFAALGVGGAPGPWQNGGLHTNSRAMLLNNLTPGTMYLIQVCAHGSGSSVSDWSDGVQHMSM